MITLKIDVRKLDKTRFFEGKEDKTGHRPLYADLVLIDRKEIGQYGDTHIVKQSKKKDEEIELPILGSATDRSRSASKPSASAKAPTSTTTVMKAGPDEDIF